VCLIEHQPSDKVEGHKEDDDNEKTENERSYAPSFGEKAGKPGKKRIHEGGKDEGSDKGNNKNAHGVEENRSCREDEKQEQIDTQFLFP
jgi:hypothetical protein